MTTTNTGRFRHRIGLVLRAAGACFVFLATAAPLPGDGPSCEGGMGYLDDSPAVADPDGIRAMCIDRCEEDCRDLQACGLKPAGDAELRLCKTDCSTVRSCAALTLGRLCPDASEPVVTWNERSLCVNAPRDPQPPACWCSNSADCWSPLGAFPGASDPWECLRDQLCDPRE